MNPVPRIQPQPAATDDARAADIAAALLRQGGRIDSLSRILTGVALLAALLIARHGTPLAVSLCIGAVGAGIAQLYLAIRVGFDAALFGGLTGETADLAAFDRAMARLGLMPEAKAGRPLGSRIAGASRLMALQGAALGCQVVLLASAAGLAQ
jgi:hypothetical protein